MAWAARVPLSLAAGLALGLALCEQKPLVAGDAEVHELKVGQGQAVRLVGETSQGDLVVRGGDVDEVEIRATVLGYGSSIEHANQVRERVAFRLDNKDGRVVVGWYWTEEPAYGESATVDFDLLVPHDFALDLRTDSGDLAVQGGFPRVEGRTGSGPIQLTATGQGPLTGALFSQSGDVELVVGDRDCVVEGKTERGGLIFAQGMDFLADQHVQWTYGEPGASVRLTLESQSGIVRVGK